MLILQTGLDLLIWLADILSLSPERQELIGEGTPQAALWGANNIFITLRP